MVNKIDFGLKLESIFFIGKETGSLSNRNLKKKPVARSKKKTKKKWAYCQTKVWKRNRNVARKKLEKKPAAWLKKKLKKKQAATPRELGSD